MATTKPKSFKLRSKNGYLLTVRCVDDVLDIFVSYKENSLAALPSLSKRQVERLAKVLINHAERMK